MFLGRPEFFLNGLYSIRQAEVTVDRTIWLYQVMIARMVLVYSKYSNILSLGDENEKGPKKFEMIIMRGFILSCPHLSRLKGRSISFNIYFIFLKIF